MARGTKLAGGLGVLGLCGTAAAQTLEDARLLAETVATGLARPTCFTFLGEADLLVVENDTGRVVRVQGGVVTGAVLDLAVAAQGGLGIVRAPDFAASGHVFLYYGASAGGGDGGGWGGNRLVRYTFDGAALVDPRGPLLEVPFDPAQANPPDHDSGLLRFGPDGMLYGQVGDKHRGRFANPRVEQNTASAGSARAGGIFRIRPDGGIPSDNPFAAELDPALRPWFVVGFRNSLGMDFDPLTGALWFGDNGSTSYDELNRAGAGMNGGWLKIMGPDARDATYSENGDTAFDAGDLVFLPGAFYRDPELSWAECIGLTAVCFLGSKRFPEDLQGDLLLADFNNFQLYRLELEAARTGLVLGGPLADGVADSPAERDLARFGQGFGVVTDMQVGPDGWLYLTDYYGGRLRRIRPRVDLVEPSAVEVERGALAAGGLAELERSDERYLALTGERAGGRPEVAAAWVATFALNRGVPARIDVVLESHASVPGARQRIELWHRPSASWRSLDERALGRRDQSVTLEDLEHPADYVDPLERTLRVRVRQSAVQAAAPGRLGVGGGPGPRFEGRTDLARVLVTWP